MLDADPCPSDTGTDAAGHQRARGRAHVAFAATAGGPARLTGLYQSGAARVLLPGCHGAAPEVVFLNTAGGLTGGDRLDYALDVGTGARVMATTQTAERGYASAGGRARLDLRFSVGAGGWLDWLPQETILFEGCALARDSVVDLAGDAGCLTLDTVVLGRAAMGETLSRLDFRDLRMIRRDGMPLSCEPLALDDAVLARAGAPALLGGARALATLMLVAPGAADALGPVRAALAGGEGGGVRAGASAFAGRLVVRMLAGDLWPLRQMILRVLAVIGPDPLPRVWQG